MGSDEGFVENIVSALRFGFSNIVSLAIWGISYILVVGVFFFLYLAVLFIFLDNLAVTIVMTVLAFLPIIAFCILLMGFVSQCLKTVIDGGSIMPTGLESPGGLVRDGIMTSIIALEFVVIEMICIAPAILLIFISGPGYSDLVLVALALMLLAIPVIMVFLFLNVIQWAIYADTGSLLRGLNPLEAIRLIRSNLAGAAIAVLSLIAACVIFGIIMFVCEILIVTILLLPFLIIAEYACTMYLVATFYRQSSGGDRLKDVRDAATSGYSVS